MIYFYQLMAAAILTAALVPVAMRLAPRFGLVDRPGGRHIHSRPVPRTGGIAMVLGLGLTLGFLGPGGPLVHGVLAGSAILFVAGVADDRKDLDYRIKFGAQVAAAATVMGLSGLRLGGLGEIVPGCTVACGVLDVPLTAFFLVAVINSVNLSDGLDGLASGLCLLVFTAVGILCVARGNVDPLPLATCTAGAVIAFLRFNTHPAVVFMGDAGSQVLGFLLGITLLAYHRTEPSANPAVLLFLLGVPALDTLSVMSRRILEGRSPFSADKNHVHHMLLQKGLRHHHAVIALYGLQLAFIACGIVLRPVPAYAAAALYLMAAGSFLLILFAFQRLPFDGALRQMNRRILLPMIQVPERSPLARVRRALARLAWIAMGSAAGFFLLAGPLWVRPIPHEIGAIAAVFVAVLAMVRGLRPNRLELVVKLGAYFCAIYVIVSMEFAHRVPLWGVENTELYRHLFQFAGLCVLGHMVLAGADMPTVALDYLMGGVVLLLFFLPRGILETYRVHAIGLHTLVFFLCMETVWQRILPRRDIAAVTVAASLALLGVLAFWPWVL